MELWDKEKKESKKHNTTIGKYLLAVYFKILLDRYSSAKNPIVIGVPADLRKIFCDGMVSTKERV